MSNTLTPTQAGLRENIHLLLATFMASEATTRKVAGESLAVQDAFGLAEAEDAAIRLRLAAVAIGIRMLSDRFTPGTWDDHDLARCGTLRKDREAGGFEDLNLREACNKVVHAKEVTIQRSNVGLSSCLEGAIHLCGIYDRKEWAASLSVYDFCRAALVAVHRFMV